MLDALAHRSHIAQLIKRAGGAVLMLDFDGTLAPIVSNPNKATISARMRRALILCSRRFSTAIVSGRALVNIRKHVRVKNISLVGNHGFEWIITGKRGLRTVSLAKTRALRAVSKELLVLESLYSGIYVEDKKHSVSVNYRIARVHRAAIERYVRNIVRRASAKHLRIMGGIFVFNIIPNVGWGKGKAAIMLFARLKNSRKAIPIFIGDEPTDEDAFKALRRGVTIRVKNGTNARTAARYTLNNVESVRKFLLWLAALS